MCIKDAVREVLALNQPRALSDFVKLVAAKSTSHLEVTEKRVRTALGNLRNPAVSGGKVYSSSIHKVNGENIVTFLGLE